MKTMINIILLTSLMFLLSSCNNSTTPTEDIVLLKGNYSGTFSVTFQDYKNSSDSITQSGTIAVFFTDSTYTYLAEVNFSSDSTGVDSLKDTGVYSIDKNGIVMYDFSWLTMDAGWHNSLYLKNTFNFDENDLELRIWQNNPFANWNLVLIKNNNGYN